MSWLGLCALPPNLCAACRCTRLLKKQSPQDMFSLLFLLHESNLVDLRHVFKLSLRSPTQRCHDTQESDSAVSMTSWHTICTVCFYNFFWLLSNGLTLFLRGPDWRVNYLSLRQSTFSNFRKNYTTQMYRFSWSSNLRHFFNILFCFKVREKTIISK